MRRSRDIQSKGSETLAQGLPNGLVFDIKRFAINDGPGIRITIFLKGCPLSCAWCHNPEGVSPKVQKMYSSSKCIGCGICVDNCPEGAVELSEEGVLTDTESCILCGACADNCPALATEMSGQIESADRIMNAIEKESIFFDKSGGGVTFSGGEPLMYPDFLMEVLDRCGAKGIHRTVDTSGMVKSETLLEVAKRTDLFLYDLKIMNSKAHKKWTRVGNELILENLKMLAETGADIQIRIPLIKGINDDNKNIDESISFISSLAGKRKPVNILPYHNIAEMKYLKLGKAYDENGMKEPKKEDLNRIVSRFTEKGLDIIVGG